MKTKLKYSRAFVHWICKNHLIKADVTEATKQATLLLRLKAKLHLGSSSSATKCSKRMQPSRKCLFLLSHWLSTQHSEARRLSSYLGRLALARPLPFKVVMARMGLCRSQSGTWRNRWTKTKITHIGCLAPWSKSSTRKWRISLSLLQCPHANSLPEWIWRTAL